MSASVALGHMGELKIVGTTGADPLSVVVDGANLDVYDSTTLLDSVVASKVVGINVYGLGGNITIDPTISVPLLLHDLDNAGPATISAAGNTDTTVEVGNADDSITLGNGNDFVFDYGGNDTIVVGNGNDYIQGGKGSDNITAGNGNDVVHAGKGTDNVTVGTGNDTVILNGGNDTVTLGAGNATLMGGSGEDDVTANGNDLLFVRGGDTVTGNDTTTVYSADGMASVTGVPSNQIHTGRPFNFAVKALIYEARI
jgi:Ca2+-binding RTX toxin-like protein